MTTIDRRQLLRSLTATTACASVLSRIDAAQAAEFRHAGHASSASSNAWVLARECRQRLADHAVDFWARPFCDIPYTQYLPRDIARCAMWCEAFDPSRRPNLEEINASFNSHCLDCGNRPLFAAHLDGNETLASTLQSLIENEISTSTARTAFIALDSLGPWKELSWADVLPAFTSCYDRTIGHFHLPQRGLRQWATYLNAHFRSEDETPHFRELFVDAAAGCDAIILTSHALIENDLGLCPRASTETLVGELIRRFGHGLLDRDLVDQIAGTGERSSKDKTRLYALGSATLHSPFDRLHHFYWLLDRQRELVCGSFGEIDDDERPILVVTFADNEPPDLLADTFQDDWARVHVLRQPTYAVPNRGEPWSRLLHVIALWPFELDGYGGRG